jgi:hypothetical protein
MNSSRRNFLKMGTVALVSTTVLSSLFKTQPAHSADAPALPLAKESDAMAKSLGFCPNADKPSKQCADRKAKEKKDQYCHSCQLYTKLSGEGKTEVGKCMLMVKNSVPANGWCKSWVQKPV